MHPQITVRMPVYNERKYITETLDPLLSQTYENFEVVISEITHKMGHMRFCNNMPQKTKE
jgi:GT2 family glycosyltransferase